MLSIVYRYTIRDFRRGLLPFLLLLLALSFAITFPSISRQHPLEGRVSIVELGFADWLLQPFLFILLGSLWGARMLAAEEQNGTLTLLLARSISRWQIMFAKMAAVITALSLIALFLGVSGWIFLSASGAVLFPAYLQQVAFSLLYGCFFCSLAGFFSGLWGRWWLSFALSLLGGLLFLSVNVASPIHTIWLQPFTSAFSSIAPGSRIGLLSVLLPLTGTILIALAGGLVFSRRDIGDA